MDVYETVKSIGNGSFGQVYLVKNKREDKLYVIKKIKTRDMSQKDRENTEQEVRLLQKLRHSNIVAYKDSYMDQEQYLNIVMIYCEGGDMDNRIKNAKSKNFPEIQILDWFAQMALALFYLHDKKILHRDLKTQNIFLKHGRVRLGDFGIAKVLDSTRDFANTCIGTPYYMSPELFKYKPYSYKSDIWALGCVMYEICNLKHAFTAQSFQGLAAKIIKGSYPPITPSYSKQLRDLIGRMLNLNPKERPTILDILKKPILKKRVIQYMADIFQGNYPEANLPNDVDDIYQDSLREQAEKLGIMGAVQECMMSKGNDIKSQPHLYHANEVSSTKNSVITESKELKKLKEEQRNNKKELKREVAEKKKIEEELAKLQQKGILKDKINYSDSKKHLSQDNLKKGPIKAEELKSADKQDHKLAKDDPKHRIKRSDSKESKVNNKAKNDNSIEISSIDEKVAKNPNAKNIKGSQVVEKGIKAEQPNALNKKGANILFKDNNNSVIDDDTSSKQSIKTGFESNQIENSQASTNYSIDKKDFMEKKEKVLFEKEKKRREEQEKVEKALQEIRKDTFESRRLAAEKKNAQYRPSDYITSAGAQNENTKQYEKKNSSSNIGANTASSLNLDQNESTKLDKSKKQFKITEDYEMYEEETSEENETIQEVDNEEEDYDDVNHLQEKINLIKEKLTEKTMRITELKQSLRNTKILEKSLIKKTQTHHLTLNPPILDDEKEDDDEESFEIDLSEESSDETTNALNDEDIHEKKASNPQYYKFQDRIKLLRHRCEASLGFVLFDKAYKYVQEKANLIKPEEMRKYLIDLLGEDNIGFWHLIDQILLLEDLSKKLQEA